MNPFVILLWALILIAFCIGWTFVSWYFWTHIDELEGPPYGLKAGRLELIKHD